MTGKPEEDKELKRFSISSGCRCGRCLRAQGRGAQRRTDRESRARPRRRGRRSFSRGARASAPRPCRRPQKPLKSPDFPPTKTRLSAAACPRGTAWSGPDGAADGPDGASCPRRLFGIKCAQCRAAFSSSDLVMRARDHVYHLECFRCAACGRQLLPGDQFCLRERDLLCRADHGPPPDGTAARGPRSPALPPAAGAHLAEPVPGRPPAPRPPAHKAAEKTTRVRTVLNEKQLHTLRTCYAANPRPDALMKEQLVEMTGLSPRVIRVWFQNKRCKDKKKSILMKQLQQQQHSDKTSLQGLTGTPLVAGSPIRHESAVQGSAVEVQTYQPPWKALSEFALQSDLEQPAAFQQLVSFSESGSLGTSSGSDVTSLSSQLPDTPNSMVPSPAET
ncbi:insulin gene enhancer protein ISL-2 [Malurus melanocephalus]|uniref:insulin gene enhancer protein ISL-2 n=1 Tax=Malurus melanocephalus TaxID=175006 RepID=UPI002547EC49|nr:insulin gene enhancer protein ISL-2 [Malurus melanocephalus]